MSLGGVKMMKPQRASIAASGLPPQQRRQTMATSGPSQGAGGARRQTMATETAPRRLSNGRSLPANRNSKDARPDVKDPRYQKECKTKIRDFLLERGMDITNKMLNSPSQQDFFHMFQALWREIDPEHRFGDKPEEEIPVMLQWLKYPFVLTKSQLKSASVPHTWPHVLACLRWFVDVLRFSEMIQLENQMEEEALLFFDNLRKGYRSFIVGSDNHELEEELRQTFDEKNREELEKIQVLNEKNEHLRREIAALRAAPDRVEELERKKQGFTSEVEKIHESLLVLKELEHDLELKKKEVVAETGEKEKEIEVLQQQKEELDDKISKQDISVIDVDRMNMEKKKLEDDLEALEIKKEKGERQACQAEVENTRKLSELEKNVQELNNNSTLLGLIPVSAKHARGIDYEVQVKHHSSHNKQIFSIDLKATIQTRLYELKEDFNQKFFEYHKKKLSLSTRMAQLEEELADKVDENDVLKEKKESLNREHEQEKERYQAKLNKIDKEVEMIMQEAHKAHEQSLSSLTRSERSVAHAKGELVGVQEDCCNQLKAQTDALISACSQAYEFKAHITESMISLSEHYGKLSLP